MLLSPTVLAAAIGGVLLLTVAVPWLATWWRNRAFAKAHGCKPVPRLSRLRNCILTSKAWRKRKLLDLLHWKYTTIGNTHTSATVGLSTNIFTVDPENIKTILAADFKKWYIKSESCICQKWTSDNAGQGLGAQTEKAAQPSCWQGHLHLRW
jgi:hypothetical protein